jgi:hypothetical protein
VKPKDFLGLDISHPKPGEITLSMKTFSTKMEEVLEPVLNINGKVYDVLWEDDVVMKTNVRHLIFQSNLSEMENNDEEPRLFDKINKETILPILSVGAALSQSQDDTKDSWPKDFYEALLRED